MAPEIRSLATPNIAVFPRHFRASESFPAEVPPTSAHIAADAYIHPTAMLEKGVRIGSCTAVWDHVHIRHDAQIGAACIIGEKTYIAYGVQIGDRTKINAFVYICAGVTIETGVMISAGTVFTNDRLPRATTTDLTQLRSSDPDEHTLTTRVREGATIGANCTIGCDLEIGRFAMIGMGTVLTRSVPDFHLVIGHPGRSAGCVCRCGQVLMRFDGETRPNPEVICPTCGLGYWVSGQEVSELGVVNEGTEASGE